jgi:hypothetical protein
MREIHAKGVIFTLSYRPELAVTPDFCGFSAKNQHGIDIAKGWIE